MKAHIYMSKLLIWMRQDCTGREFQIKVMSKRKEKKKKKGRKADARLEAAKDKLTLSLGGNVSVI